MPAPAPEKLPPFERGLWNRAWFIVLMCLVFVAPFALGCAATLSITRLAHQFVFDEQACTVDDFAAALVRFFVLLLLAALTNLLGRQSRQLRQRVQQLEGILPICAGCKSIRDESDNWVQLEGFISARSSAQFSHSFCPDCYKKFSGLDLPAEPAAK